MIVIFWGAALVGSRTIYLRVLNYVFGDNPPEHLLHPFRRNDVGLAPQLALFPSRNVEATLTPMTDQMEVALRAARATVTDLDARIAGWRRSLDSLETAMAEWGERAQVAVQADREDLARLAIGERQAASAKASEIQGDLREIEQLRATSRGDIAELEERLSNTWRREVVVKSRMDVATSSLRARELLYGERTKDALAQLDALEQEAALTEGKAAAMRLGERPAFGRRGA